jgi:hypothetical protein
MKGLVVWLVGSFSISALLWNCRLDFQPQHATDSLQSRPS